MDQNKLKQLMDKLNSETISKEEQLELLKELRVVVAELKKDVELTAAM